MNDVSSVMIITVYSIGFKIYVEYFYKQGFQKSLHKFHPGSPRVARVSHRVDLILNKAAQVLHQFAETINKEKDFIRDYIHLLCFE